MAKGLNLKATFSADTRDIKKGAKEAQAAVKEFESKAGAGIDAFAGLFGASMSSITQSAQAFQGGLLSISKGLNTSAKSSSIFSKALGILKLALIATGVGAIVVALASLVTYFKKSQDGADKLARMMEPLKLAFDLVTDAAAAIGRAIVGAFENPKEAISKLWEFLKNQFINRLTGFGGVLKSVGNLLISVFKFDGAGIKTAFADVQNYAKQTLTGLNEQQRQNLMDSFKGTKAELAAKLDASNKLMIREQQLEKDRIAFIKKRADLEAAIAKQREIAADTESYSAEERLAAQNKAISLTKALYSEEAKLAKELLDTTTIRDDLAENMNSDNENLANAYSNLVSLQTQQSDALRTLLKRQATLTNEAEKEREEREKMAALLKKKAEIPLLPVIDLSSIADQIRDSKLLKLPPVMIEVKVAQESINSALVDIKKFNEDISGALSGAMEAMSSAIGETLGLLLSGKGDWEDVKGMILGVFADMAVQVGQIAIAAGVATLGIKAALESLNGYVAIAAGIALVALGSAVKASLSNIASGSSGGSFSSNTYKSNSGGTGGSFDKSKSYSQYREGKQDVKITGELVARNGTLSAVIDSERNSKRLRT